MIVLDLSIAKLCIEIYIPIFIYVIVFEIYTTHLHFINNCHRREWKNVYETNVYWQEFDVEMSATHRFQVEVDWDSIQWLEALCLLLCICLKRTTKEQQKRDIGSIEVRDFPYVVVGIMYITLVTNLQLRLGRLSSNGVILVVSLRRNGRGTCWFVRKEGLIF